MWPKFSLFLVQNALSVKRCFPFPLSFSPPPSSTNHNLPLRVQPASSSSPPHQPSPFISLSHESRLSNTACPFQIFADLWVSLWSTSEYTRKTPVSLIPEILFQGDCTACVDVWVSYNCISAWMQLWSGVFGLDGDLRPPLAAPEVEEGGGGGVQSRSGSCVSGLCWVGVLLSVPWSFTQPTPQPSSVARLPLTVHRPHHFSPPAVTPSPSSQFTTC